MGSSRERIQRFGRLERQLGVWKEIQAKDLAALNEAIKKNNIPAIATAVEKPGEAGK